jgi:hypothetical protein
VQELEHALAPLPDDAPPAAIDRAIKAVADAHGGTGDRRVRLDASDGK